jgi:hypothetical protein
MHTTLKDALQCRHREKCCKSYDIVFQYIQTNPTAHDLSRLENDFEEPILYLVQNPYIMDLLLRHLHKHMWVPHDLLEYWFYMNESDHKLKEYYNDMIFVLLLHSSLLTNTIFAFFDFQAAYEKINGEFCEYMLQYCLERKSLDLYFLL